MTFVLMPLAFGGFLHNFQAQGRKNCNFSVSFGWFICYYSQLLVFVPRSQEVHCIHSISAHALLLRLYTGSKRNVLARFPSIIRRLQNPSSSLGSVCLARPYACSEATYNMPKRRLSLVGRPW